jgi:hypothetical protein
MVSYWEIIKMEKKSELQIRIRLNKEIEIKNGNLETFPTS